VDLFQIVVLSLVQGITEFLPISSSAHLILVPMVTGWEDQGLAFDVAVHAGTLAAVLFYFRAQLTEMFCALSGSKFRPLNPESRLAWHVVLATLPVALAGLVLKEEIESSLRMPVVIATTTILFGLVLWFSDHVGGKTKTEYSIGWKAALLIGIAQVLALIPGTSRAGITITAALLLGLSRTAAARFSFLLSIPTIFAAGVFMTADLLRGAQPIDWITLGAGFLFSAVSAYFCIDFFIRLVDRTGMLPYVIYRLVLGVALLLVF
jgi:undecaprenyl-diphosphatase